MSDEGKTNRIATIEQKILLVRGEKAKFPLDFMFQTTEAEKAKVVANCDHLHRLRYSSTLPYVFTEHGALMAASVLNSQQAGEMSVFVIRAFVRLRQLVTNNRELVQRLDDLENQLTNQGGQIQAIIEAIRELMSPKEIEVKRRIGFKTEHS